MDSRTAKRWLSILQASFIVFLVQPYYRNFNKRLVRRPKLFFCDTGLACSLLGLRTAESVALFLSSSLKAYVQTFVRAVPLDHTAADVTSFVVSRISGPS